ncbi:MAG: hypothetical protein GY795_47665 [Desulfobacterales bacterium]|nr:hypothetical protein [Desulfobacterales bacterium]
MKDGIRYCEPRGVFGGYWYDFYERGLSCMEGECYDAALSDFDKALKGRHKDQRKAKTFGMHFIDYFPHREKGVIYYLTDEYDKAKSELELSIGHYPTAKALFYLDEVRKRIMKREKEIVSIPKLVITAPSDKHEIWISDDPVAVSGIAEDKQYVSEIVMAGKPVFIEASRQHLEFKEYLSLAQGRHEIGIIAKNLLGGEADARIIINVDRSGPVITLEKFSPGVAIEGYLYDDSGDISLFADEKAVDLPKGKNVKFNVKLEPGTESVNLLAMDKLGNKTRVHVKLGMLAHNSYPLLAQNQSDIVTDTDYQSLKKFESLTGPEITVKGWKDHDTAFKESVNIEVDVKSESNIEKLRINSRQVLEQPGRMISFNHFMRLKQGENTVRIQARDESGNTSLKEFYITRLIPKAFQLTYRYSLAVESFENTGQKSNRILLQHHFLEKLLDRKRFQVTIPNELEDIMHEQGLDSSRNDGCSLFMTTINP